MSLQHNPTLREVLMALKIHWPIRASRKTLQSEEEGLTGALVPTARSALAEDASKAGIVCFDLFC